MVSSGFKSIGFAMIGKMKTKIDLQNPLPKAIITYYGKFRQ
jgi:hypothetical protein